MLTAAVLRSNVPLSPTPHLQPMTKLSQYGRPATIRCQHQDWVAVE